MNPGLHQSEARAKVSPMMKKTAIVLILALPVSLGLFAKGFWDKPFRQWKKNEVSRMLKDSPWAKQTTVTRKGQGRAGEEYFDYYIVRFFSALPVRQAYVRSLQIQNKYDKMDPDQRQAFDQQTEPLLHIDVSSDIVVVLECRSNDRQLMMQIDRGLTTTQLSSLQRSTYLISERLGKVELKGYLPPSSQQPDARFIFPRTVDGQPVVSPEDKKIKFEIWVPGTGTWINFDNKTKDLIYNGKLEI